jgi:uncharacterized metal-binding protein YceD (DUF177 family)
MDYLKQFVIQFGGLKPGVHQFSFLINEEFFEHFEFSEIKKGEVDVGIDFEREEKMLVLHFSFNGKVEVPCDRCYIPFFLPIKGEEKLIVKFGKDYHEENENIQIIPEGELHIDVSPFIYEYVHLLMPFRKVHPEDENGNSLCDPEVIKRIDERETISEPDPRWEVLKKLKTKI